MVETRASHTLNPKLAGYNPNPRGFMTSEFWIVTLLIVGIFVLLFSGKISVKEVGELWPIFASAAGYALSRGVAKTNL